MAIAADASFFSSIEKKTHFYLLRHGQSEGNARRKFQGRMDLPLSETGRAQARAVGTWLADKGIGTITPRPSCGLPRPRALSRKLAARPHSSASMRRS